MRLKGTSEERFVQYTDRRGPDECWPWKAYKSKKGYGTFYMAGYNTYFICTTKAHRLAMYFDTGVMPPDHLEVCHSCDNPGCVNPKHLFLGTRLDNMTDMKNKGRRKGRGGVKGEKHCMAKVTWLQVREIRSLYKGKHAKQDELAARFGMTQSGISAIVRQAVWKEEMAA